MPFEEEVFAKTWSSKENDFVTYKFKGDINILEKFRYIDAQLDLVVSRLENLIKLLSSGKAVFDSGEGLRIVEELQKEIDIIKTKLSFYVSYFNESQAKLVKIKNRFKEPELKQNLLMATQRIKSLETGFGIPKNISEKNLLLNLIENIEALRKRIKVQDETINKIVSTSVGQKVAKVRRQIKTEL